MGLYNHPLGWDPGACEEFGSLAPAGEKAWSLEPAGQQHGEKLQMKNEHPDVQRQQKYPMPGTDLGETTAIPFNQAHDVDLSGNCMSFVMGDRPGTLKMASNPTRQK
jgi:hypothetical protein